MKRLTTIISLVLCCAVAAVAQVQIEASIDSIDILVGQQAHVTLKATAPNKAKVEFPQFKPLDHITPGVEVVETKTLDDKAADNDMTEKTVVYTLTSFDDTLYYLPPLTVKVDGKPYKSKSLALKVITMDVDTTHYEQFFGPKDVQDNPFLWSEWRPFMWLTLLLVVMLAAAVYLYTRLKKGKPIITHIRILKRQPPHQKALQEIEQIKADKMVTAENPKEYYTKLTDTLRKYIEERYGFRAMEMTSNEIIERLMAQKDQKAIDELRQLFTTADLVKFAKYSTLINENDMNLVNAIDFINQTKQENEPTEEVEKPQLSEEEIRSQQTRRVLKATITTLGVASAAVLIYIIYGVWQLLN